MLKSCFSRLAIKPPVAKRVPYEHEYFGKKISDPYHWLKDQAEKKNPEIIQYLEQENAYCSSFHLKPNAKLIDKINNEIISRIKEDDSSVPVYKDPYFYYYRTEKGLQYRIYLRSLNGKEQVLLDQNKFDYEYQSLGAFEISPDHKILAYSLDLDGSEYYTIFFKDLESGDILSSIERTGGSIEWFKDSKTIWYNGLDDIHRSCKVFRYNLDTKESNLVYHEQDEKFGLGFQTSNSGDYLFMETSSTLSNENWFVKRDEPQAAIQLINPREPRHLYSVEHQDDAFIILTDRNGQINAQLMTTPTANYKAENWTPILPYDPMKQLLSVIAFQGFLVLYECFDGAKHIRVVPKNRVQDAFYIQFDEQVYTLDTVHSDALNYFSSRLRFTFTSLLKATQTWEIDMGSKERKLLKEIVIPHFDPSKYTVKRIYAPIPADTIAKAPNDTPVADKIPISLVYKTSLFKGDGTNPLYLYGYGSYGISIDPEWSASRFSLIDRGFVYAIAHIRGGGDCGKGWYECGKFKHKRNTFTDFIACADTLVKQGYSKHHLTAIEGRSAGGLLIGATLNIRPDVCGVAVAGVPFVDVINTMMDPSIPLTVEEYEEWGNPNEKDYFDYIESYSPYDNVPKEQAFPDILVKAGLTDPRVSYWEPAKWVAKMRYMCKSECLLFDCKMGSGHFGSSGRYAYIKEVAADYAFVIDRIQKKMK